MDPNMIIAKTGQQGSVLYRGDKDVNDAALSPEGGPADGLSTSSLLLLDNASLGQSQQQINAVGFVPLA